MSRPDEITAGGRRTDEGEATGSIEANGPGRYVSTGHLPSPRQIQRAVDEAYRMYRSENGGTTSQTYPALARVPGHLFGICVAGIGGGIIAVSPGKGGLGTFSPLLDRAGNSVRGQLAARHLSRTLGLSLFASQARTSPPSRAAGHI